MPNCPGAKLSTFIILVPNCPAPNCPVPNCPVLNCPTILAHILGIFGLVVKIAFKIEVISSPSAYNCQFLSFLSLFCHYTEIPLTFIKYFWHICIYFWHICIYAFTNYKVTTSKFTHCSASHAFCHIFEGFLIVLCLSFRRSSSHLPRIQHFIHALIIILALCGWFCICPFVFKLMACRSPLLEGDAQTSRFIDCEMNKNDLS